MQRGTERLKRALEQAEAVMIGAGAGLSASAGFTYAGKRFQDNFSDFGEKYGFTDMYAGGFYPYPTLEEYWAFWSRYILINRYCDPPKPVYQKLLKLVEGKDYFVITTNVDHCFQKAGFEKERLFYTQGDYGLLQCAHACHKKTYDNEALIRRMVKEQQGGKIPSELIPRCPVCGRPMVPNLRCDGFFVEDEGWHAACGRYEKFGQKYKNRRVLYLELGVGANTPAVIKYPFRRRTLSNKNATYACVNFGEAVCPRELADRSVCINADIGEVLKDLREM